MSEARLRTRLRPPRERARWDERKVDHVREYTHNATQHGVVIIVIAQEVQKVFMGYTRRCKTGSPQFAFYKADRRVTVYSYSATRKVA